MGVALMHVIPSYPPDYQRLTPAEWLAHLVTCPVPRTRLTEDPLGGPYSAKCDACKVWFTTISSSEATP